MINQHGICELELKDQILMNKLIRNNIDFQEFNCWYEKLNIEEQAVLVSALFEFSYQSGVEDNIINDAFEKSDIPKNEQLIQKVLKFNMDIDTIEEWYLQLTPKDKSTVFKYSVYLFGIAENNAFKVCFENENCNHWWHRNILNDNVIKSIMNNPKYYLTSKNDDIQKNR